MRTIADLPLPFPSDVSAFRVEARNGLIHIEVFQRGEDDEEPLITAQLTPADAYWLRVALARARELAKNQQDESAPPEEVSHGR